MGGGGQRVGASSDDGDGFRHVRSKGLGRQGAVPRVTARGWRTGDPGRRRPGQPSSSCRRTHRPDGRTGTPDGRDGPVKKEGEQGAGDGAAQHLHRRPEYGVGRWPMRPLGSAYAAETCHHRCTRREGPTAGGTPLPPPHAAPPHGAPPPRVADRPASLRPLWPTVPKQGATTATPPPKLQRPQPTSRLRSRNVDRPAAP